VPFLFSHRRQLHLEACELNAQLVECIVPINDVEAATGLDFFTAFPDEIEAALEAVGGQTA
jgi:DNA/RNA endonuclease G (NUC1)